MNNLIQSIDRAIEHKTYIGDTPATTTCKPTSSGVTLYTQNSNTCQTRSMTQPNPQLPKISTPSVPRLEQSTKVKRKHRNKRHKSTFNTTSPVHNKISRTQTAATPSAIRIRARTRLTRTENKTHKGQASKVETTTAQLENDVYEALEVMDTDTRKLLNYR